MLAAVLFFAAACAPPPERIELPPPTPDATIELVIDGVVDGVLDLAHTCHGQQGSMGLRWEAASPDARSAAWILEVGGALHWVAWNADVTELPAGLHPATSPPVQGWNDLGGFGFHPPCPAAGEDVPARLSLWALSGFLRPPPTASRADLYAAIAPREQGSAVLEFTVRGPSADAGDPSPSQVQSP